MLKDFDFSSGLKGMEKEKRSALGEEFARLQRQLKKTDKSLLIIVDGWESSGKGFVLKDLTRELDPRYFEVSVYEPATDEEKVRTFLWRFVRNLPGRGNIAFFDRSFYYEVMNDLQLEDRQLDHQLLDISYLERLLSADGTLVIKLFLHHTKETMASRIKKLDEDPLRHILISKNDKRQLKQYDEYLEHLDEVLEKTNFPATPWHVIPTEHLKNASRLALNTVISELKSYLSEERKEERFEQLYLPKRTGYERPLASLDLSKVISDEEYEEQLEKMQKRAGDLLYQFFILKIPCILVFEGTDAAGKGGAIQRLTRQMDPRGYDVATTAAPTREESNYHYLWRFYKTFPEKGRLTVYDRSWYGRVLVERVEGFTPEMRWQDAYDEINEMEHNLTDEGHLLLKFLIVIDKEEQRKRFIERQNDPEKNYKLTDEDWRNHEKFAVYEEAMNDMLERTSTEEAPWVIVEGQDKKYARITVLKTFIAEAEKFLAKFK